MLDKKIVLFYSIISLFIIILALGTLLYFWVFGKPTESPQVIEEERIEGILQSLTAPGAGEGVSEKILQSLTAPQQ